MRLNARKAPWDSPSRKAFALMMPTLLVWFCNGVLWPELHLPVVIKGRVVDQKTGRPVAGVKVTAYVCTSTAWKRAGHTQTRLSAICHTKSDGSFRFSSWIGSTLADLVLEHKPADWQAVALIRGSGSGNCLWARGNRIGAPEFDLGEEIVIQMEQGRRNSKGLEAIQLESSTDSEGIGISYCP